MVESFSKDPTFITDIEQFHTRVPDYFRKAFVGMHGEMMKLNFDSHLSGSTVCSVVFDGNKVFCSNVGDSRAVLYSHVKKNNFRITPLSEDHKPSLPNEKKRILSVGGRVEPI